MSNEVAKIIIQQSKEYIPIQQFIYNLGLEIQSAEKEQILVAAINHGIKSIVPFKQMAEREELSEIDINFSISDKLASIFNSPLFEAILRGKAFFHSLDLDIIEVLNSTEPTSEILQKKGIKKEQAEIVTDYLECKFHIIPEEISTFFSK